MIKYNPHMMTYEDLNRSFVARWPLLNEILEELRLEPGGKPRRHWMLHGPRGIGKSHFLTLLYHKVKMDEQLGKQWIPLLLPEEPPTASNLAGFLEKILPLISKELSGREGEEIKKEIDTTIKSARKEFPGGGKNVMMRSDAYLALFDSIHRRTGRRVLLLAENMQTLLGKIFSENDQQRVRSFLHTSDSLLIIGTATSVFNEILDQSAPFYDFFHISRLKELDSDEMKGLIFRAMEGKSAGPLTEKEKTQLEPKLLTLQAFTGGNPRMAMFAADIIETKFDGEQVIEIMNKLVDELTPYFLRVFEDVPAHQREIIETLAEFEPAQTPTQIAEHLGAPVENIRNYLIPLKDNGFIRMAHSFGKNNYYGVSEYLYRVWYQMRNDYMTERNRWLVEILLVVFTKDELLKKKSAMYDCAGSGVRESDFSNVLFDVCTFIENNPDFCLAFEDCVNNFVAGIRDEAWNKVCNDFWKLMKIEQFTEALELLAQAEIDFPDNYDVYLFWGACLSKMKKYEEAVDKFRTAERINSSDKFVYALWGECLKNMKLYVEAIEKYKRVTELDNKYYYVYGLWAICLKYLHRLGEAVEIFLKAIAINPDFVEGHGALAVTLCALKRFEEANKHFKIAAKLDASNWMGFLSWGISLIREEKHQESFEKLNMALKLKPDSIEVLFHLGKALAAMGKYDDAIAAFTKVLENANERSFFEQCTVFKELGLCYEKIERYEESVLLYLKYVGFSKARFFYGTMISSIERLDAEKLTRLFYSEKPEGELSKTDLVILLTLVKKYEPLDSYFDHIDVVKVRDDEKWLKDFDFLLKALQLIMNERLSEGEQGDALKILDFLIKGFLTEMKLHEDEEKGIGVAEGRVVEIGTDLFVLHAAGKAAKDSVTEIIGRIKAAGAEGLPYSKIIEQIWKCVSEPDSRNAKIWLNEPAVAAAVRVIHDNAKRLTKMNTPCPQPEIVL